MFKALNRKAFGVVSPLEVLLFLAFFALLSTIARWQFAAALIAGLFVHEMGHVVAMRAYGMRIKGVYFVFPFGAVIPLVGTPPSRFSEAIIGLAGPAAGLLTAIAAFAAYAVTHETAFAGVAGIYAFFNLFNLLPARPLDGGRAASALAFSLGDTAGLVLQGAAVAFCAWAGLRHVPILLLVALVGWSELRGELRRARRAEDRRRIVDALAKAFGCPASARSVRAAVRLYQTNVVGFGDEAALVAWIRMFRREPEQPLGADEARRELLAVPAAIAASARVGRIPLFATATEFVTGLDELQSFAPPIREEDSPLATFLAETERPRMGVGSGLAVLAAYVGLAALLWLCIGLADGIADLDAFTRYAFRR